MIVHIPQPPDRHLLELTADTPEPVQSETPDEAWAGRLTTTFERVKQAGISGIPAKKVERLARESQVFFEIYFSNFIEGTEFPVKDAERIIFDDDLSRVPENRLQDALELVRAWQYASSLIGRAWNADTFDEFLAKVKQTHEELFRDQRLLRPGRLKVLPNVAGMTQFADPEHTVATLKFGFDLAQQLPAGLPRAIVLHHTLIGAHLFVDGNGRTTRMVMNAHLSAMGECRIIVPIGHRVRYVDSLEDSFLGRKPLASSPFLATMQKWTASVQWGELDETERQLKVLGAMQDPNAGQVPFDEILFGDEDY